MHCRAVKWAWRWAWTLHALCFCWAALGLGSDVDEAAEARKLLKQVGIEAIWPDFAANWSLLKQAWLPQRELPASPGEFLNNTQTVSTSPLVLLMDEFLTPTECDFLRALGRARLTSAKVVQSSRNWYDVQMQVRNNEQLWITGKEEKGIPLLRHILKRMHRVGRFPDEFAEALQIGRYNVSTKYELHADTDPLRNVARPATIIMYLSDVDAGGDTLFPLGRDDCGTAWRTHPETGESVYGAAVCCDTPHLDAPETIRLQPKKGRAVLFFNHGPDNQMDRRSEHIACPVTRGEKWIAQRWLRFEPYDKISYTDAAGWDVRFDGPLERGEEMGAPVVRTLSHNSPRLYLAEHFLAHEECNRLVQLAEPHLNAETPQGDWVTLAGAKSASAHEVAEVDASAEGSGLLTDLLGRVQQLARIPPSFHNASLRIRRISVGGAEHLHVDSNAGSTQPITVVAFLSSAEEGGAWLFPSAQLTSAKSRGNACSEMLTCCSEANRPEMLMLPRRGDALIIHSHTLRGDLDPTSEHAVCPIQRGETWVAEFTFRFAMQPWDDVARVEDEEEESEGGANEKIRVLFESKLTETAKLVWVSPGTKEEVDMGDLPPAPNGRRVLNSYDTHVFRVRDSAGKIIEEITVGPQLQQLFIIMDKGGNDEL